MKKILVPFDFSEPAQEALKFAMQLAKRSAGSITALQIFNLPMIYEGPFAGQPYIADASILEDLKQDAIKRFEPFKRLENDNVTLSFEVSQGAIVPGIINYCEIHDMDLVVMGTHGADGLRELFVGSHTEKVVRKSPVPVLAVNKSIILPNHPSLVLATNLKLDQENWIKKVKELQEFLKARLHVLYVNTPGNFLTSAATEEALDTYAKHYQLKDYTLNVRNDINESEGILAFAQELRATMIITGTHSRRGLAHWLLDSISEGVVNHLHCPVWTYSVRLGVSSKKMAVEEFSHS